MFDPHSLRVEEKIFHLIASALSEDQGDGDHTSLATIDPAKTGLARVKIKQDGIISGTGIARQVAAQVDDSLRIQTLIADGNAVKAGDLAMIIEGNVRSLLRAERLILNFMQRMSGIATM